MDLTGAAIDSLKVVHKAITSSAEKCKEIVEMVKKAIISDDNLRLVFRVLLLQEFL